MSCSRRRRGDIVGGGGVGVEGTEGIVDGVVVGEVASEIVGVVVGVGIGVVVGEEM